MSQPSAGSQSPASNKRNPYVGPRAFRKGELFFGREIELTGLLSKLLPGGVVLLHSPSGAGKTSLIQASVVPELVRQGFEVCGATKPRFAALRVNLPPPEHLKVNNQYVFSVVNGLVGNLVTREAAAAMTIGQALDLFAESHQEKDISATEGVDGSDRLGVAHLAREGGLSSGARLSEAPGDRPATGRPPRQQLVVLDQLEEVLSLKPSDLAGQTEFFRQLGAALRRGRRWALLAMREDYMGGMDQFKRYFQNELRTTFRIDYLHEEAALLAVQKPAAARDVRFEDDAAHRLVADLRRVQTEITASESGSTFGRPVIRSGEGASGRLSLGLGRSKPSPLKSGTASRRSDVVESGDHGGTKKGDAVGFGSTDIGVDEGSAWFGTINGPDADSAGVAGDDGLRRHGGAADTMPAENAIRKPTPSAEPVEYPYIEPVLLQVICDSLWRILSKERGDQFTTITINDLERVKPYGTTLSKYYRHVVREAAEKNLDVERAIRDWIEQHMLTKHGMRRPTITPPPVNNPQEVLVALQRRYLIRDDPRPGGTWWELAHDMLAQPIIDDNRAWRASTLFAWQVVADDWQRFGRPREFLLTGSELREARSAAKKLVLTPVESAFLEESRAVFDDQGKLTRLQYQVNSLRFLTIMSMLLNLLLIILLWKVA